MLSPDRLSRRSALFGLAGLTALSACGYRPLLAPTGPAAGLTGAVAITAPDSEAGYRLLTRLEDRLGRTTAPRLHLRVAMDFTESAAAVSTDNRTSRYNLSGEANWELIDLALERVIDSGTVNAFTGYGTGGNTVAIRAGKRDAEERLAHTLADRILTQVYASKAAR